MANAASMPGSSQVWRPDGTAEGAGGWGDVGAVKWNDGGQERDPLSDNDDDTSSSDDDGYEGDFVDVPCLLWSNQSILVLVALVLERNRTIYPGIWA